MGSSWRKAKRALGLNLCVYVPSTSDDPPPSSTAAASMEDGWRRLSEVSSVGGASDYRTSMPTTPVPSSSGLKLAKSGSRSKKTCAICLGSMKAGQGHALFTAECSHTFHFHCIVSNVKYGNRVCPICRAKWKEVPFQGPQSSSSDHCHSRARVNPVTNWPPSEDNSTYMAIVRRLPRANSATRQNPHRPSFYHTPEPSVFNDDEPVNLIQAPVRETSQQSSTNLAEIKTYTEFLAMEKSVSKDNFMVLINLSAPHASADLRTSRAPVDLITVLDVSGSMAGTKLALLKRAMGFVIQNLGPADRLSVIAFSSVARRLFPLRRMTDSGKQQALQSINALTSSGGTNIAEGLGKAAKVIKDRQEKNPVSSIILLSDGQDTYAISSGTVQHRNQINYGSFVPSSVRGSTGHAVPVHAFGFGADHDAVSMHSISEVTGGTFSFIEDEGVIQDAFAQCIGGLLSVVVQEMSVEIYCLNRDVQLGSVQSGGYSSRLSQNRRSGIIDVGDLYADEERDFLVTVNVPSSLEEETLLLNLRGTYRDPFSGETVNLEVENVKISRPDLIVSPEVSIEVDRERNRVQAAEAMVEAKTAAEHGEFADAINVLENRRRAISASPAGRAGDGLCVALDLELKELQERMMNRQRYESSGRAYVLSGLSSHSWQRATARGDSTDSTSIVGGAYQTPSMIEMLQRSQTFSSTPQRPPIRPTRSFGDRLKPR